MSDAPRPNAYTYAAAGVDIDRGEALVRAIAPLDRRRPRRTSTGSRALTGRMRRRRPCAGASRC